MMLDMWKEAWRPISEAVRFVKMLCWFLAGAVAVFAVIFVVILAAVHLGFE